MRLPKMILFDYGQTLVNEQKFDGIRGTEAVLQYATKNKYNLSAEQIQSEANRINQELGRFDPATRHLTQVEVPNVMFSPYLYESQGIEVPLSTEEIDKILWDAAAPGVPTEGIGHFLEFLTEKGIRTGVVSNISYAQTVVANRIQEMIPDHEFEFILTSSQYVFRKPHERIFRLALEKADLPAEDVWYIGDQFECDIKGAAAVGMTSVWYVGAIDMPWEPDDAVFTVKEWTELEIKMDNLFYNAKEIN